MASLTCSRGTSTFGLSDCLPITSSRYSIVTAIFTIGGLCGSLGSSYVTQRSGLHGGILLTGYLNLAAALLMALSYSWLWLALGRFVAGLSSGVAVCLVPPYLAQVARSSPQLAGRSGLVGSMHQMGIVIGLFAAQVVGWVATGEVSNLSLYKGQIPRGVADCGQERGHRWSLEMGRTRLWHSIGTPDLTRKASRPTVHRVNTRADVPSDSGIAFSGSRAYTL